MRRPVSVRRLVWNRLDQAAVRQPLAAEGRQLTTEPRQRRARRTAGSNSSRSAKPASTRSECVSTEVASARGGSRIAELQPGDPGPLTGSYGVGSG